VYDNSWLTVRYLDIATGRPFVVRGRPLREVPELRNWFGNCYELEDALIVDGVLTDTDSGTMADTLVVHFASMNAAHQWVKSFLTWIDNTIKENE
jgi:hypothetical protein